MAKKKTVSHEQQPWNLSYKISFDARPSWSRHGMPILFEEFIKLVKKENNNAIHLDIGCGDGIKTINFVLAGLKTIGADISKDGFKVAKELIKELRISRKCRVIEANALSLPFNKDSFGSASDILMFTHLKHKAYLRYKKELSRVLNDGAYVLMVLFSDKDKHFHGHKVTKQYTFRFDPNNPLMQGFAHYHGMYNAHFSRKDIKDTFSDMFEIVKIIEVKHPLYAHRFLWNVILKKPNNNVKSNSF